MEGSEYLDDVVFFTTTGENSGSKIVDYLEFGRNAYGEAKEKIVIIIKTSSYKGFQQHVDAGYVVQMEMGDPAEMTDVGGLTTSRLRMLFASMTLVE